MPTANHKGVWRVYPVFQPHAIPKSGVLLLSILLLALFSGGGHGAGGLWLLPASWPVAPVSSCYLPSSSKLLSE